MGFRKNGTLQPQTEDVETAQHTAVRNDDKLVANEGLDENAEARNYSEED